MGEGDRPAVSSWSVIDPDEVSSWPPAAAAEVLDLAAQLRGTTDSPSDLAIDFEHEDAFRARLTGHRVLAYHATRLLPHEVDDVRRVGLRAASLELIRDRIDAALTAGAITPEDAGDFRTANVFDERDHTVDVRQGVVNAFLGRRTIDDDIGGLWRLLTTWGGEIVSMSAGGTAMRDRLRHVGQPAIVVLALDLSAPHDDHPVWPGLLKVMVATVLGLEGNGADVRYQAAVQPDAVLDVWVPGHPEFEKHDELQDAV